MAYNDGSRRENDVIRLIKILFRNKWIILLCILAFTLSVTYYNKITLPVYEASSMIVCEETRGGIPTLDLGPTRLGNTFISNQIQEIKSWSLMNQVVYALPEKVTSSFPLPELLPQNFNKEEFLTSALLRNVFAEPVANSDVIKIKARAYNPEAASFIANTVAENLQKRNLNSRLGEIHNVRKVIEEQLAYFKQRVEAAAQALRNYKETNKVTFLNEESQEIFRRISDAEIECNRVKAEHEAAEKRLIFIESKLVQQRKDLVPAITTITSPWAQRLKASLIELEVQYTTLKVQDYADNHPKMQQLKSQIAETQKNLREETLKIARGENTIDPLSQIEADYREVASLKVQIHTFQAQQNALDSILSKYNSTLKSLPEKELKLGRLLQEKTVADNIYTMLLQRREEAKITEAEKVGNIRIIDPARTPKRPISPRKVLNLLIGFIVGASLGIGIALIIESFDNSIKTIEEIENSIKVPVFSSIPRIKSRKNGRFRTNGTANLDKNIKALALKLITGRDPKSPGAEAFRTLRSNIQFLELDSGVKTIMITSSIPSEGKSLTAANLAIVTAQMGVKTLLIDLDLRKPVQHSLFGKSLYPGTMDIIAMANKFVYAHNNYDSTSFFQDQAEEVQIKVNEIIHKLNFNNLHILTCGRTPSNPSEILGSNTMKGFLEVLKKNYEVILIDTPPVLSVTDAAILGRIADGIILVIRAGKISRREVMRVKQILQRAKGNLIGTVLNEIDVGTRYGSYYGKYYGEYYGN